MKRINAKHSILCKSDDSIFNYFGWPSVAKLPDGTLAAVGSGFRVSHVCPFGKSIICYSRDKGETWTRPAAVIDTPLDDRDSGIVVFGGNRVMITSFNNTIADQRDYAEWINEDYNSNATNNYLKALKLAYCDLVDSTGLQDKYYGSTYVISEDGGYTFGDIKKVPVTSIHGPCVTPWDEVLYFGRVWETERDEKDCIECWRLNDNDDFEYMTTIENISDEKGGLLSCEPCALALPGGRIILMIRVQRSDADGTFTTYCSISDDYGKTFTKPVDTGNNGAPCHIMQHSSGVIIATYGYRNVPYGQRVMFSHDNGESWDMDYILRDDGPSRDLGYPCTVELDDGTLLTVYYQQEPGHKNTVIMQSKWSLDGLFDKK